MIVNRLLLSGYRNLKQTDFEPCPNVNIIFGNKIFQVAVKVDALIISPVTMLILITLMAILISAITFTCCRTIKNMKPTELMEE